MQYIVPKFSFQKGELSPSYHSNYDKDIYFHSYAKGMNWMVTASGHLVKRPGTLLSDKLGNTSRNTFLYTYNAIEKSFALELGPNYIAFHQYYPATCVCKVLKHSAQTQVKNVKQNSAQIVVKKTGYIAVSLQNENDAQVTVTNQSTSKMVGTVGMKKKGQHLIVYYVSSPCTLLVQWEKCKVLTWFKKGERATLYTSYNLQSKSELNTYQSDGMLYLLHAHQVPFSMIYSKGTFEVWGLFDADPKLLPNEWTGTSGNYPTIMTQYHGRSVWTGVASEPSTLWFSDLNQPLSVLTRTGLPDSAFELKLQKDKGRVMWLLEDSRLTIGTNRGIYTLHSKEGYIDASKLHLLKMEELQNTATSSLGPIKVSGALFYMNASGSALHSSVYSVGRARHISWNCSLYAHHLFERNAVKTMSSTTGTEQIIWMIDEKGQLIGMTLNENLSEVGWHRHRIAGIGQYYHSVTKKMQYVPYANISDFTVINTGETQAMFMIVWRVQSKQKINATVECLDPEMALSRRANTNYLDAARAFETQNTAVNISIDIKQFFSKKKIVADYNKVYDSLDIRDGKAYLTLTSNKKAKGSRYIFYGWPYPALVRTLPLFQGRYSVDDATYKAKKLLMFGLYVYKTHEIQVSYGGKESVKLLQEDVPKTGLYQSRLPISWVNSVQVIFKSNKPYPATVSMMLSQFTS